MKTRSWKSEAGRRKWRGTALALMGGLAIMGGLALGGCKARRAYPDLNPGWHSVDYTTIMGRIQLVKQAGAGAKTVWVIHYDNPGGDPYNGRLNLYPDGAMAGYSGGEMVEVKGSIQPQYTLPGFPGTWFHVDEIRMWSNHAEQ